MQGGRIASDRGNQPWRGRYAIVSALTLASLLHLGSARAQTGATELAPPQQQAQADPKTLAALGQIQRKGAAPFTLNGMLETGLGQGSFVADAYARNPYFAWALSMVPAYYPLPSLTLAVHLKLAQELTESDIDNHRYQPVLYDMQLRCRYSPPTIPVAEINSIVELRTYLPTSKVSRYETLILGLMARWAFFRSFGPIVIAYGGSFRKNFHQYQSPVLDPGEDPMIYARLGGADDLRGSNVAIAGNNVSFAIQNALSLSYVPLPNFSVSLSYGLANAWTYASYPKDDMSSPYADGGRGQRDTTFGGLDLWYRFDQRFSLSGGVFTSASPKTDDNQSYRFPFYDFTSTASNLTTFYLALTVTEFLGG